MMFYKIIIDNYIEAVAETSSTKTGHNSINEQEYNELLFIIRNRPTAQDGYTYKLRADTLEWELVELPPIEEDDDEATESDYIEALNDLGATVE